MPKDITDQAALLRETMDTLGWEIIQGWLDTADLNLTKAIKEDLIKMNWSERDKWLAHYAGQAEVLAKFQVFLKNKTAQPFVMDRIRKWKQKQQGLDS